MKDKILKMLDITFDELCKGCDDCSEDKNCVLFRILNGVNNIYGEEIKEEIWE